MKLPPHVRVAVDRATVFAKRLRNFLDAEARHRDLELNHKIGIWFAEVRAELTHLAVEQDVAATQVEAQSLTVVQLEQELQRLRTSLALLPASLPAAMFAVRAGHGDLAKGLASSYAIRAMAALPHGAAVLDASDDPEQLAWSLATLGYEVTPLRSRDAARPKELPPRSERFDGIVALSEEGSSPKASEFERLREVAKSGARLVLSVPLERLTRGELDERQLQRRLPGWTIDDCTLAEQRVGKGLPRSRRIALVTGRAI